MDVICETRVESRVSKNGKPYNCLVVKHLATGYEKKILLDNAEIILFQVESSNIK